MVSLFLRVFHYYNTWSLYFLACFTTTIHGLSISSGVSILQYMFSLFLKGVSLLQYMVSLFLRVFHFYNTLSLYFLGCFTSTIHGLSISSGVSLLQNMVSLFLQVFHFYNTWSLYLFGCFTS